LLLLARSALRQVNPAVMFRDLALDGADIRQWISSQIPAKHKKCGLDATERPKSLQNCPQNPILYQQII
jgi:hypothetical protein